jgi:hypothetical protein
MSRRSNTEAPDDPAQEIAALTIERDRLDREHLFLEVALEGVETMQARARRYLDELFPPMNYLDPIAPEALSNPHLTALWIISSDGWKRRELERIADGPRPGVASVQWSVFTKQETAARIVEIGERLAVLEVEVAKQAARDRIAADQARLDRLERGEPADEPPPELAPVGTAPTETAIGNEDDLGAKAPGA